MSNNPINLLVRFLLEIAILVITALWGWNTFNGNFHYIVGIGLPLLIATVWGVFRVDNDPGKAPVPIPGWLRLLFELLLFAFAVYCLFSLGHPSLAYWFLAISLLHYIVSYDRISWLLKKE